MMSQKENLQNKQTLEEKQKYLRQNILERNYDIEHFIDFMNERLNVDSDIDKCSLADLQKVVKSYTKKVKQEQVHMSELASSRNSQFYQSSNNSDIRFDSFQPRSIKICNQPIVVVQDEFKETFKCMQIHEKYTPSEIKSKKIKCKVHSPQRQFVSSVLGMITTSSYLQFKVETHGFGWLVGRRYSDFIWLRSTLRRFYPSQIIPPIPNKKAHKKTTRHLEKRMAVLTLFLNDLLSYPEFLNSKYIQAFLSYEAAKFESFKKQTDSKKYFESITTTQTISGHVDVSLSKQILQYTQKLPNWVEQAEIHLKQLTRHSKFLKANTVEQVNTLYQMGDNLANLHKATLKVSMIENRQNRPESQSGLFKVKSIFTTLNNMVVQWGSILKNQIQLLETNCNVLYKYVRESLMGYREVIQTKNQCKKLFIDAKIQLDKKKYKIFELNDINKWDLPKKQLAYIPKSAIYQKKQAYKLMLPKQSAQVEKLKMNFCYYATRLYENSNQCLSRSAQQLCDGFEQFTIKSKVLNQQMGGLWNQMAYNFSLAFKLGKKELQLKTQQKLKRIDEDSEKSSEWSQSFRM